MAWIYEKYVDNIDMFLILFHFSYVKTVWDKWTQINKIKNKNYIAFFKKWSPIKSTWDLHRIIILRFTFLMIVFEGL